MGAAQWTLSSLAVDNELDLISSFFKRCKESILGGM